MEERKNDEEFSFIKEKIKNKPLNKRRIAFKLLLALSCGILFGIGACVTFLVAFPHISEMLEPDTVEVTIPKDNETQDQEDGDAETGPNVADEDGTGTEPGATDGDDTGAEPGTPNGAGTGTEPGTPDGDGTVAEPGTPNGAGTGTEPGTSSGDGTGAEPGTPNGDGTGAEPGTPNGDGTGAEPGTPDGDGTVDGDGTEVEPDELEPENFQSLQNKIFDIGKQGNRSIVTVTGVSNNIDWFDSPYESESQTSGIIIANNEQELLILTEKKVTDEAEEIHITFINDDTVPAVVKKADSNTGIAIISVALSDISVETMEEIELAVLGNSYLVDQGSVVIAIGSPLGTNYSILSGTITSSANKVTTWDANYTIFTTDIIGSSTGSGVLLNLNGEVVGLMLPGFSNEGDQNTITALAISQLKEIIESLSNEKDIPYLGMRISTVTEEIEEDYGLPRGVYIRGIETAHASPAMNAGLQEADVIVEMDGEEILTAEQYVQKLHNKSPEDQIEFKVLRQNGEDYAEMDFTVTVGVMP